MSDADNNKMNRREFFRRSFKSATEASDARSLELSKLWFRPPFAQDEIVFLDRCTRCGECIQVCPTDVIIPLPEKYGLRAAGTPAMDLINKPCVLCEDWPCVQACEPQALLITTPADGAEPEEIPLSAMAQATIDHATCIPYLGPECGACADSCPVEGALVWDGPKPAIDVEHCVGCALCRQACITDPKSISIRAV